MRTWAPSIMLGTLFGLIVLIFGVVLRFDPEARRARAESATGERWVDAIAEGGHRLRLRRRVRFRRRRRLSHISPPPPPPPAAVCIAAISISWIEAPYDWAMYAQFAPAIPRMPSWWPLNMTWGGLPASVPVGYISYFVTPALVGAALGDG